MNDILIEDRLKGDILKKRTLFLGIILISTSVALVGCHSRRSSSGQTPLKIALITDASGVNDRSFNQSAWEGLKSWGKENGIKKGIGFNYYQSNSPSEYATNYDSATSAGYNLQFGIGFTQEQAIENAAQRNSDVNYVIIDSKPSKNITNLSSALFADNEGAYLAGVAAAKTTKTNEIGFIGGQQSDVITRFEKGYIAGANSVNPNVKINIQYANSFTDASKGKTIAHTMYSEGTDVIFQCAGATGAGVFSEAKALNSERKITDKVWLIGVDQDQRYLGTYVSNEGKKSNFVLASTIKEVGKVVKDFAKNTQKNKFSGGKTVTYNLKNGGVDLKSYDLPSNTKNAINLAKIKIINGKINVPVK